MKVMQFLHGYSIGGAETLVKDYCLNFNREDIDLVVLCLKRYDSPYEKMLEKAGIRIIYLEKPGEITYDSQPKRLIQGIKRFINIRKYIRKERPDILHTHLCVNRYVKFARPHKATKIVHTVHSDPDGLWNKTPKRKLDFRAAQWLVKHYDMRFIALHESMKKRVNDMFHVRNTIILKNGIDLQRFNVKHTKAELRSKYHIPENAYVVGHVGRFSAVKNHFFLIDIFMKIYRENSNAFLLLVGGGELQEQIRQKIEEYHLLDHTMMLTNRTDVPELLKIMDIFIFPSKCEGLPLSLIEVQKVGVKCLISNVITKQVIVSNLIKTVNIDASAEYWAHQALSFQVDKIEYYGIEQWNITQIVSQLHEFYKEIMA